MEYSISKQLAAEFLGTFGLAFGGGGSAVLAAKVCGARFNSAVSIGLAAARRFKVSHVSGYSVAQCVAAIAAAVLLCIVATCQPDAETAGFASKAYGDHSPERFGLLFAALCDVAMKAVFLFVILRSTSRYAVNGIAGSATGSCPTVTRQVLRPATNTSVSPTRNSGPALFAPGIPDAD